MKMKAVLILALVTFAMSVEAGVKTSAPKKESVKKINKEYRTGISVGDVPISFFDVFEKASKESRK